MTVIRVMNSLADKYDGYDGNDDDNDDDCDDNDDDHAEANEQDLSSRVGELPCLLILLLSLSL